MTWEEKKEQLIFIDGRVDSESASRFSVSVILTLVFLDKSGREFHKHGYYSYGDVVCLLRCVRITSIYLNAGRIW